MAHITVVSPTYNEEKNVEELYNQIKGEFEGLPAHTFDLIFIDNASSDNTVEVIKRLIANDPRVRLIVNSRNFGHIRSPFYGLQQAEGDCAILMASDLQDPPKLIPEIIARWEAGAQIVKAVKTNSEESFLMFFVRKSFYSFINRLADVQLTKNYTGFGLYDRRIIAILREIDDPYPYFRGLISDLGFEQATVEFFQPSRKRGLTKNNFYTLYDMGVLGITNHTKIPLRLAIFGGVILGIVSFLFGLVYLLFKILYWDRFVAGTTPILIGVFFFSSVQLFFLGILGEYIGGIFTQVQKRPLVFEKERVNFTKVPD